MLTELQRQKANEALYKNLPMFKNFEKEIAFRNYQTAIEWIDTYNLPFRIGYEYLKAWNIRDGYVKINPCYPAPGYRCDDLIHLRPDEVTPHDPSSKPNKDGSYNLCLTPINEDTRQQIKELCYKLRPWNLETAAGLKQWEFEFAHFLNAAQLNTFTYFDWFGVKSAPNEESAQKNQQRIYYWLNLQADYQMNPEAYRQEEPPYLPGYDDEYTHLGFVIDWDNKKESTQYSNSMM